MKLTAGKYAKLLYEITANRSAEELPAVIDRFVGLLRKNKSLKLKGKIYREFLEYYNGQNGVVIIEIQTAAVFDPKIFDSLALNLSKALGVKKVIFEQKVNKNLIGGAVFKIKDLLIDASLRKQIAILRSRLQN